MNFFMWTNVTLLPRESSYNTMPVFCLWQRKGFRWPMKYFKLSHLLNILLINVLCGCTVSLFFRPHPIVLSALWSTILTWGLCIPTSSSLTDCSRQPLWVKLHVLPVTSTSPEPHVRDTCSGSGGETSVSEWEWQEVTNGAGLGV